MQNVSEDKVLAALRKFKDDHGPAAVVALLRQFNASVFSQLSENDYGAVTMRCSAGIDGLKIEADDDDAEFTDDDAAQPSTADQLNDLATEVHGRGKPAAKATLAEDVGDHKTVAGKLDAMGRFANASRKVKAVLLDDDELEEGAGHDQLQKR